jgi:hypothetical protein
MIDLPVGKALIAVFADKQCEQKCTDENFRCAKYNNCCDGCDLFENKIGGFSDNDICSNFCCIPGNRQDKKFVVYKLVDYPGQRTESKE